VTTVIVAVMTVVITIVVVIVVVVALAEVVAVREVRSDSRAADGDRLCVLRVPRRNVAEGDLLLGTLVATERLNIGRRIHSVIGLLRHTARTKQAQSGGHAEPCELTDHERSPSTWVARTLTIKAVMLGT
jgi:hypothetical protein